ncbi:ultraviolet-B receptor UVR8-like [Durio zibethinus]|uniref:Ultraviolet-B receptor UVR8-like n=1 Tax=Durio zibethinus TaxID=66656 RepID=A0A6P6A507_DURZI|nr:ultraviolet-B receptor UVR8-like [Durio zibethinus]
MLGQPISPNSKLYKCGSAIANTFTKLVVKMQVSRSLWKRHQRNKTALAVSAEALCAQSTTTKPRWMSTVMSFGDGNQGALGLPESETGPRGDAYEPTRVPGLPSDITSISAGHYHSLAIDSRGGLWAWGRSQEAQLGRDSLAPRDSWNDPKRVEGLDHVNVCAAFASGVISAAIGDDGSVWVWGKSKRGQLGLGKDITEAVVPRRVEALAGEKIVKVSFGWGHALAQTEDGKLLGWGYSADGRIGKVGEALEASLLDSNANISMNNKQFSGSGLAVAEQMVLEGMEKEKDMPIIWEPQLVEELQGVEVKDIVCGLDHSLVLCCNGTLLSSGSNIYGQLGRLKLDLGLLPVDLSVHPVSVASGLGHSLVICEVASPDVEGGGKSIFSWGWNQCSQLGRQGPENLPSVIEGLEGETPLSVSGGRVHSIAVTSKGQVWVWGCGKNGRLGLGSSSDEVEPILLDYLEDFEVLQAVSGFDHNLILIAE